jgi:hypothetical protein
MSTAKEIKDFEGVIEKIVFNEGELDELKIAIRNFSKGIITPKQLKQDLISCRGRIAKELLGFLTYCLDKARESAQAQVDSNFANSNQSDLANDRLRREVAERNELLEVVAKKISALAPKAKKAPPVAGKSLSLEEAIRTEIERVFLAIKVNEWLDMCGYDDYKFFVKLYPKLEELYSERFGESEKSSNNAKDGKDIMANKMVRLGFPEEIETLIVQYVAIRNVFQHSMNDISPSNLKLAQEAFVKVLIYLIVSSLDPKLVSNNKERIYSCLNDFFSKRLAGNPLFRERMLERFKIVFYP